MGTPRVRNEGNGERERVPVVPDWIAKANINHFKKLLETEKDPQRRAVIVRELADEEAKLASLLKEQRERRKD